MIEGQICLAEGEYSEAIKYFEKAGVLGDRNGYYQAILTYEKLRDHYFKIGDVEDGAWCDQQMEICGARMMK